MYDVIIVGAGPAGLMAARALEDKDINFLVIDSKKDIGLPLKCGEGTRVDGFEELFQHTDYDFVKNKTEKFEVVSGKAKRTIPIPYLVLDRPKFEQWLAKPVKKRIRLKTSCKDVIKKQDGMELITDKGKLKANMVILCNGCDYRLQKKFNLINKIPITIPCIGGIFTNHNIDTSTLYFSFDDEEGTGFWIFPKDKKTANVGMGVVPEFKKRDLKVLFQEAIKKPKLKGKISFAGVFPTTGPIRKTYADRLLVCGNAAGQVYGGSGEGIYYALKAGKLAGETTIKAVKQKDFKASILKRYEKAWKKDIGGELKASLVFTYLLFLGFKYKKLEKLFMLPKEKDLIDIFMYGKAPFKAKIACIAGKVYDFLH